MRKLIVVIAAMIACAPLARGQCSNGPCYTANPPAVTRLTPAQAAAKGIMTATLYAQATDISGNVPSHNLTVTPGTWVGFNWTSANGTSWSWYDTFDNDPTPRNGATLSENGNSSHLWLMTNADVGHKFGKIYIVTDANGNSTRDRISVMVVAGNTSSIVSQDALPENTILHFHASGGGGSMLNDFTMCQLDPRHCINATHTPYTTLTVSNLMSGESQNHLKHISGNIAKQNENVSFSDDMFFSALPEDVFTYSEDDEVDCSISGPVGVPPVKMDIRFERAITEEYISSIINSNGMHPEHIYCIIAATPPDFPGADEALPGTPSGQVVNIAFLYREWPIGTQEKGVPWQLVFPDIQEFGIGYYVKTTMEPDPVGCTMWDNGFRHLDLPTPLDPQPQ